MAAQETTWHMWRITVGLGQQTQHLTPRTDPRRRKEKEEEESHSFQEGAAVI